MTFCLVFLYYFILSQNVSHWRIKFPDGGAAASVWILLLFINSKSLNLWDRIKHIPVFITDLWVRSHQKLWLWRLKSVQTSCLFMSAEFIYFFFRYRKQLGVKGANFWIQNMKTFPSKKIKYNCYFRFLWFGAVIYYFTPYTK